MRLRRKILIAAAALPLLILLVLVAYIRIADLSGYARLAERAVEQAIGRRLTIAGRFDPDIGFSSHLVAEDVTLANPDGSLSPVSVHVDRLSGAIDLWSLISGPIRITDVALDGVTIHLENPRDGRASWDFDLPPSSGKHRKPATRAPVTFDRAVLTDVELTYDDLSGTAPWQASLTRLSWTLDALGTVVVDLEGTLNGSDLELSVEAAPYDSLFIRNELAIRRMSATLGSSTVELDARFASITQIEGVAFDIAARGPEITEFAQTLRLPPPGPGPFDVALHVAPLSGESAVRLAIDAGEIHGELAGTIDSCTRLQRIDLDVQASGPDLSEVGRFLRFDRLPPGRFEVRGHLQRDGDSFTFNDFVADVSGNRVSADGVFGGGPGMLDAQVDFSVDCPDSVALRDILGVALPPGRVRVQGQLARQEKGIELRDVQAALGSMKLDVDGLIALPAFVGSAFDLRASGLDLSELDEITTLDLPAASFAIAGRIGYRAEAVDVDSVELQLGPDTIVADGSLSLARQAVGTELQIRAAGPDLAATLSRFGVQVAHIPSEPFKVDGGVSLFADGYAARNLRFEVGDVRAELDGRIGAWPGLAGTDVRIDSRGEMLASLNVFLTPWLGDYRLPDERFVVLATVEVDHELVQLETLAVELGDHVLHAQGSFRNSPARELNELSIELGGPALADLGRMLADSGVVAIDGLPGEPYAVAGRATQADKRYRIDGLILRSAEVELQLDGIVAPGPRWVGTDLTIDAHGSSTAAITSVIASATDVVLPNWPFALRGRAQRLENGFRFDDLSADLGEYHARLNGKLGDDTHLDGTQIDVRFDGPGPELFTDYFDVPGLLRHSFSVQGHLDGDPSMFALRDFEAEVGPSDLSGSFTVDLTGVPHVEGRFSSNLVDVSAAQDPELSNHESEQGEPGVEPDEDRLLLPTTPLDFAWLERVTGDVLWTADEFVTPASSLKDVELGVRLLGGSLQVQPLVADGFQGGRVQGAFSLEPSEDGHRIVAALSADGLRPEGIGYAEAPELGPTFDLDLDFIGSGSSIHEIVSGADGSLVIVGSAGKLDGRKVDLLAFSLLQEIMGVLNPFTEHNKGTELECSITAVTLEDGLATVAPLAMRTDKTTIVGRGRLDFKTEKIDLEWTAKPRKGIGLSTSAITNPYVKLGGTLSSPALDIKPFEAVASTSVAVATVGLSILARGLWDRATAEKKVCAQALKEIEEREQAQRNPGG